MKKLLFLLCLTFSTVIGEERFPAPSLEEIVAADVEIEELGKAEVFSLSRWELGDFIVNRYWRGKYRNFSYYGANPQSLTPAQAAKPAILLLHAMNCNQGEWIPLLSKVADYNKSVDVDHQTGPVFTLNYDEKDDQAHIIKKIETIRALYLHAGKEQVELILVGHSLGAIVGASYSYNPESWVENSTVKRLISIAGRLKNIDPPTDTPFYAAAYDILPRVEENWQNMQENRGAVELISLAAENDWLLLPQATHIGDHQIVIPGVGHTLIAQREETFQELIKFLGN